MTNRNCISFPLVFFIKHQCTYPGCHVLVFDGNMKNRRDICAATESGYIEYEGFPGAITGCQQSPAYQSKYCYHHSPRIARISADDDAPQQSTNTEGVEELLQLRSRHVVEHTIGIEGWISGNMRACTHKKSTLCILQKLVLRLPAGETSLGTSIIFTTVALQCWPLRHQKVHFSHFGNFLSNDACYGYIWHTNMILNHCWILWSQW